MSVADVEAMDYSQYGALVTAGTVFAAEPTRAALSRAFDLVRAQGLPVIFDIDYRPYSFTSAQIASDVLSKASELADMIYGDDEEFGFMVGFLATLAQGQDIRSAVMQGSACAAIVVSKPRCAPTMPTSIDLENFLADHPGPTNAS